MLWGAVTPHIEHQPFLLTYIMKKIISVVFATTPDIFIFSQFPIIHIEYSPSQQFVGDYTMIETKKTFFYQMVIFLFDDKLCH